MRALLLSASLVGLLFCYNGLPHRGPDLKASRYQTLLKVNPEVETVVFSDSDGNPYEIKVYNSTARTSADCD